MTAILLGHGAVTWTLVGLIWAIQRVHYPLFAQVGTETFPAYHAQHVWRVTGLVVPLMFAEAVTAGILVGAGRGGFWLLASLVPLAFIWLTTLAVQVPLHSRLARGFDAEALRKLIRSNRWRAVAWTLRGVCIAVVLGSRGGNGPS